MSKLRVEALPDLTKYCFNCPGCGIEHYFMVWKRPGPGKPHWSWNGNLDAPTFSPALIVDSAAGHCECFLQDGVLQFLNDCHHAFANRFVPLPNLDNSTPSGSQDRSLPPEPPVASPQALRRSVRGLRMERNVK